MPEEEKKELNPEQKPPEEEKDKNKPVTQGELDKVWKMYKETEERLEATKKENADLVGRISTVESSIAKPPISEGGEKKYGRQPNGSVVFPQTQAEWDDFAVDHPTEAMDLRIEYRGKVSSGADAQRNSAIRVSDRHPDMYQRGEDGKVLRGDGNRVMEVNGQRIVVPIGYPIPDLKSEKYKVFDKIVKEYGIGSDGVPYILQAGKGPELIMAKMEAEMSQGKKDELQKKADAEAAEVESERQKNIKGGKTTPPGGSPPPAPKKEVSFENDFEKSHAEKQVAAGVYKDMEEYCRIRDDKTIPMEKGRRPSFS